MCKRNIEWLPLTYPQLGSHPKTQACALTGNQTGNLSVCRLTLNPQSLTSRGTYGDFSSYSPDYTEEDEWVGFGHSNYHYCLSNTQNLSLTPNLLLQTQLIDLKTF